MVIIKDVNSFQTHLTLNERNINEIQIDGFEKNHWLARSETYMEKSKRQ